MATSIETARSLGLVIATAAVFSIASSVASPALAADDYFPETTEVEFGTGWYLRGEIGGSYQNIESTAGAQQTDFGTPVTLGIGGGYHVGNYLRAEMNLNQINNLGYSDATGYSCGTYRNDTTGLDVNDQGNCYTTWQANVASSTIMGHLYADGPEFFGVTPYAGIGLGVAVTTWNDFVDADICRGINGDDCQGQGAGLFVNREGEANTQTDFSLVYSVGAGFSFDVSQNAKIDVGYKYTRIGGTTVASASDNTTYTSDVEAGDIDLHEIRVGLRYEIW